jgi:hypothetical protein
MKYNRLAPTIMLVLAAATAPVDAKKPAADELSFRALSKQLVEINTTLSVGSCTDAAKAMQARLVEGGFAAQQHVGE